LLFEFGFELPMSALCEVIEKYSGEVDFGFAKKMLEAENTVVK